MSELDIDDPLYGEAKPKRHREPFVQISLRALIAGGQVLRGPKQFLVWAHIHYKVWAEKSNTVKVSNAALRAWGVGRHEKYKALRLLEEAGLVRVDQTDRESFSVTLAET